MSLITAADWKNVAGSRQPSSSVPCISSESESLQCSDGSAEVAVLVGINTHLHQFLNILDYLKYTVSNFIIGNSDP